MLASIAWLKRYVDIDVTPEELADKLTRVGLEVESVIHQGQGITGVVTGKVTAIVVKVGQSVMEDETLVYIE
jgi:phenylalanyl-tRNA synthetase beta chain